MQTPAPLPSIHEDNKRRRTSLASQADKPSSFERDLELLHKEAPVTGNLSVNSS